MRPRSTLAALFVVALGLAGCSSAADGPASGEPSSSADAAAGSTVSVVAAFYPLEYAAQRVGGDRVTVTGLTPAGAEPHDLELTAQQVAQVADADLVLYLPGFQPAVDEAVAQQAPDTSLDVTEGLTLLPGDPHVWLNPLNMAAIGESVAERLSTLDATGAGAFADGAASLSADMTALDQEWAQGTATCENRDLVVSHEAFGYLADRYDLTQVGISGISPEAEPSPQQVAEIARFVRDNGVTTVYFETLVDPQVAQTVADEAGATTAVLDPLEGLAPGSDQDYLSVMRTNLDTVRTGQRCT
ncbi:MAG: metal ABC transporter substrate-binding protein [Candidatus Nanopelagicales bacterium]